MISFVCIFLSQLEHAKYMGYHIGRLFLLCIGWISIGLGILGIALPLLPTTPFFLLAGFCFSKASPRFELWLLNHPIFGPIISNWREYHMIPWRVKCFAVIMLLISAVGIGFSPMLIYGKILIWVFLFGVSIFILTRCSKVS